jgi:hypothetical protein
MFCNLKIINLINRVVRNISNWNDSKLNGCSRRKMYSALAVSHHEAMAKKDIHSITPL